MRRVRWIALATLACALAAAAPAAASDHLMRVNEIQLSADGDSGKQFVEFVDAAGEPFTAPSYTIAVHNGSGTVVGTEVFNGPGYGFANDSRPYVLATDAAAIDNRGGQLRIALPAAGGQVCFYRGATAAASQAIDCLGYGSVANPVLSGMQTGAAPGDGRSLQRCATAAPRVGTPTPGNLTPTSLCSGADTSPGQPAQPAPGPVPPETSSDTRAPLLRLGCKARQDIDRLTISVRVDEDATVMSAGSVRLTKRFTPPRSLALRSSRRDLKAAQARDIRLRLTPARLQRIRRALHRGGRLRAQITVSASDAAGNTRRERCTIALRD